MNISIELFKEEKIWKRVGGGLPVYWHFMDFKRVGPTSGPPLVEKVIEIIQSRDRTGYIALVAHGDTKRYILATENMKVGDLIRTSCEIPRIPVKPNEGNFAALTSRHLAAEKLGSWVFGPRPKTRF